MDLLTFISEILKALAWPVSMCIMVFSLRHHIGGLFKRLSSLKHNDTELKFAEDIDRAKEVLEAKASPVQRAASSGKISETENRILRLIEVSPAAGLVEAW